MKNELAGPGLCPDPGHIKGVCPLPWSYVIGIALAELLSVLVNAQVGLVLQIALLSALLVQAIAVRYLQGLNSLTYRFYMVLSLVPLSRMITLALPLAAFSLINRYFIVGFLFLAAALITMRSLAYKKEEVYLSASFLLLQFAIGLMGIPLGLIEFNILQQPALLSRLDSVQFIASAVMIMLLTGFAEEFVFRGMLQKAAEDYLGRKQALFYITSLYALLHISSFSPLEMAFAFAVAMCFALLVRSTGSLWGVALAHGLANVTILLFGG